MAIDKLVDSTQLDADLTSIADAIRTKGGTSAQLAFPADFVSAIEAISGGGASGLALLASGTYTLAAIANPLVIPVSYTGTPIVVIVVAAERAKELSQHMTCVRIFKPSGVSSLWNDAGLAENLGYSNSDQKSYGAPSSPQTYKVTSTQISFPRQDSTRIWRPVNYNWYIYGEETT